MKTLFLLLTLTSLSFSQSKQIVFVLADSFDSTSAKLVRYEKVGDIYLQISKPINVNLGKKGLAWGLSDYKFKKPSFTPIKQEGDKKAVVGVFALSKIYTYHDFIKTKMPYEKSTNQHICIDDTKSNNYNKIIKTKNKKKYSSFENMLLKNETYEYVIVVQHNKKQVEKSGSCIFLHVQNPQKKQTSGCTSMKKNHMIKIVQWLDINKEPILIQTPKKACFSFKKEYPFINCNL
mgnify:CR=1 FL=1